MDVRQHRQVHRQDGLDTLIGPDVATVWYVTGSNAGTVGAATFSSFENLTGGSGADQFVFLPGGSVGGNIDGGGGTNTLDYSAISTPVTLNLAATTSTGIGGTFTNINDFIGGWGINTVVGPNGPTTYTITGPNTIMVLGLTSRASRASPAARRATLSPSRPAAASPARSTAAAGSTPWTTPRSSAT